MNLKILLPLLLVLLVLASTTVQVYALATYEAFNDDSDNYMQSVFGDRLVSQSFTAESTHAVSAVDLKLMRVGKVESFTIMIQSTMAVELNPGFGIAYIPSGVVLSSVTVSARNLPTVAAAWFVYVIPQMTAEEGKVYAVVLSCPARTNSWNIKRIQWCVNIASLYPGTFSFWLSAESRWAIYQFASAPSIDAQFAIYG